MRSTTRRSQPVGSRRRKARGGAAVEFALVLMPLLIFMLSALDWSYYFYVMQIVNNAAREAARAGSISLADDNGSAAASATLANYLTRAGLDSGRATSDIDADGNSVSVQVVYPTGSLTGFAKVIVPDNAVARAEMRR